jgi:protein-tyrosine phosphatase
MTQVGSDSMSISETNRRCLALSGQSNFRDLGGHRALDGRSVRWGQIYRSGELSALSDEDVERLAELGLRTVVDLRSATEMESKGPDRLPPGAEVLSLTIDPGDLSPIVGPAFATGDFSHIPPDLLDQINRAYVRDCRDQLRNLLSVALDPANRPLVFHCTQGKDRAGISAAILLSALGVSWEGVIEDYLLSNVQRHEAATAGLNTLRKQSARKRGVAVDEVDLTNIRGLFFVDAAYLGAAHDEIHALYGSVESFVGDGLGWSESELARLRDELLE